MVDGKRFKDVLEKLYRLNYWFSNEMLEQEKESNRFEEDCRKTMELGALPTVVISTASENAKCMKLCMEDTVTIINYLRNEENQKYIEPWQMIGVEAMLRQCGEDHVIPYDLPSAVMATLGMWEQLKRSIS